MKKVKEQLEDKEKERKKRRRTGDKKEKKNGEGQKEKKRRKGKEKVQERDEEEIMQENLEAIPAELLDQILTYLEPTDILELKNTSNYFYNTLTGREVPKKDAINTIGLNSKPISNSLSRIIH